MNQFIDRFAKLPRIQKIGVALVVYALVIAVFYFLLYAGKTTQITDLGSEREKLVAERDEVRKKAENREQFEREVADLDEQLAAAVKELPNEREIPELLRRISTLGKKNGLEFLLFQPLPEVAKNFYTEVPVRISVQGAYHEVAMFFDRVGKLNRIVNISDINMSDPSETSGRVVLTTQGTAVTYRFIEQGDTAPTPTAAGGTKEPAKNAEGE